MSGNRVLVLGANGLTGGAVAARLEAASVVPVRATRRVDVVQRWKGEGKEAVHLDLDDARTFPAALAGIDRLFVMTGYTSAMTHQTKTIVDAAVDAGVRHVVHLGVFGNGKSTDPHFAWHELVERYIEGSGLAWTHLHPHMFMENLITTLPLRAGRLVWPIGDKPMGFIANADLAAVAATVLAEGPDRHHGKGYWMSTDLLDGPGVGEALSRGLGTPVAVDVISPDQLPPFSDSLSFMDPAYAASGTEFLRQIHDGRMDHAAVTTGTVGELLGRPPIHLDEWAARNREALLSADAAAV